MADNRLSVALADRYRIERELGQGGMATVYLAHDLKHDRKVALKVLHPELGAVIGAERFLQEIKTTARLQHPHILGLIDSGEADGLLFYVMPFVEGETLRSRLLREHQLPLAEALRIVGDVAEALDYAHKRGVIHRDIKPENILLHEGRPQVADFGIALAIQQAGGSRMTQTGMSLGTPQYMAPEQAMGDKSVDARADLYALGAVTYEILTGEPPFTGPTPQAIVAKVMTEAPKPPNQLRRTVPPHVSDAVLTALEKLPADRFAGTGEFVRALGDPAFTHTLRSTAVRRTGLARPRGGWLLLAGIAALAALGGAVLTWALWSPGSVPRPVVHFETPLPDSALTVFYGGASPLTPTGDGRLLWTTASGIHERSLDGLGSRRLRQLEGVIRPLLQDESPDGTQLLLIWSTGGFPGREGPASTAGSRVTLAVVPAGGGPARELADSADYAAWGNDGYVYFTYFWARKGGGLARVPVQGGAVDTLATFPSSPAGDIPHNLTLLPGGRGVVVTLGQRAAPELAAFDLRSRQWRRLGAGGPAVSYVEPGYLLFASGRTIMAAPFDPKQLAFTAPALPLLEVAEPSVNFSVKGGVLTYWGAASPADTPPLVIEKRNGATRELPNVTPGYYLNNPSVSPDGRRFVVVGIKVRSPTAFGEGTRDLLVYQLPAGPMSRLPAPDRPVAPTWLPGGAEIGFTWFAVDTPQSWTIMRARWDGSESPTPVLSRSWVIGETSWLPGGKGVVFLYAASRAGQGARGAAPDIGLITFDRPDSLLPLVTSPGYDGDPAVSPDGRFLAYRSNESGRDEVWVRPLAGGARRQVSLNGGVRPTWAWSGKELFFFNEGRLHAAEIRTTGELSVGKVTPLFSVRSPIFMPAPLPGDSEFVGFGGTGEPVGPRVPVGVVVGLPDMVRRLFAGQARNP